MTWPPPQFAETAAQRNLRVLVHAGHPYIHAGDLADWIEKQSEGAVPLVGETVTVLADEVRRMRRESLASCDERRRSGEGELSGGERPRPPARAGDAQP